ncbi:MAG TPA: phosphotransferase, partial [Anaerolineales bacterium]|nr:phosphotransferase [Anaerolineales bacterium]
MSLFDHIPAFSIEDAIHFAQEFYRLQVQATALPSERDQNFLLQADNGNQFVLKIANATEERSMLEAQNQVMQHLANYVQFCPRVIPTLNGEEIIAVESASGERHFLRLVTYLRGTPLGNVKRHSPELLQDLGFKVGEVNKALRNFDHPALHRDFHWDLANGPDILQRYEALIQESELRQLIRRFRAQFEHDVTPLLPALPRSIVHNDANNFNLLAGGGDDLYSCNQNIVGLIDFGDMVYSYAISDLAVAIAYAILDKPDPLAIAAQILKGYYAACPLTEHELAALFGLVTLRLCMSACIAADQQSRQPDNKYLGVSQAAIRTTLPKLAAIHPNFARAVFREACGLSPFPGQVAEWLKSHTDDFASPIGFDLRTAPLAMIDLSIASPLFSSDPLQNDEPYLTPRIFQAIQAAGATLGIGRYNEARYIYIAPAFATGAQP